MASFRATNSILLSALIVVVILPAFCHAFGAGNIASTAAVEGQNWRHGDIEDTLLNLLMSRAAGGKKFSKLDVKRVYFGNWLRDYSQAVDVGAVKYVSADAVRLILWILGFMSFGFGTKEFEVTKERLGCYRPEEHIDNPKDYADNIDARQYDPRLRAPVDEARELAIDPTTGMKTYIASERMGITTSAGLVRNLFGRSIALGRQYARNGNEADLYEALRLLGTGCHCLEDFSAHSNYCELALIEIGERDIFPHVGRRTQVQLRGAQHPVYPVVTGTFGGVDFLHSVLGEVSDKATQSEIQELEGTFQQSQNQENPSLIKDLLSKLPSGLFGGEDQGDKVDELHANSAAAQMQQVHITPKRPEAFTVQLEQIRRQIYPIIEWHDNIMKSLTETIEKIPILPDLLEQLQSQISIFVFSLIAPFILPVLRQVKAELSTGSSEIIQSSREKQLIVFRDDNCNDPTHSVLSKDHFSNILNSCGGSVASEVLKWVVPQLIQAWDDESIDPQRTLNRIIAGVFHHPALRNIGDDGAVDGRMAMFRVVERWWHDKPENVRQDYRQRLSRQGVEHGRNHHDGVHDSGHGCCKPLGMPNMVTAASSGAIGGVAASSVMSGLSEVLGGGNTGRPSRPGQSSGAFQEVESIASQAVGGGAMGSVLGSIVGGAGASLLGDAFGQEEKKKFKKQEHQGGGAQTSTYMETAHRPGGPGQQELYGQASFSQTSYQGGGGREEYKRYEQGHGGQGYGYEQRVDTRPIPGGGMERRDERRYEKPGGKWETHAQTEVLSAGGQYSNIEEHHYAAKPHRKSDDDSDNDEKKMRKKAEKQRKKQEKKMRGGNNDSDDDDDDDDDDSEDDEKKRRKKQEKKMKKQEKRRSGGGGGGGDFGGGYPQRQEHGGGYQQQRQEPRGGGGHPQRQEYGGGRFQQQEYGGSDNYGGGYQRQQEYGGGDDYGGGYQRQQEYGGGNNYGGGYQRQQEYGSGGYGNRDEDLAYGGGGSGYGGQRDDDLAYGGGSGGYGQGGGYGGGGGGYGGGDGGYGGGYGDRNDY